GEVGAAVVQLAPLMPRHDAGVVRLTAQLGLLPETHHQVQSAEGLRVQHLAGGRAVQAPTLTPVAGSSGAPAPPPPPLPTTHRRPRQANRAAGDRAPRAVPRGRGSAPDTRPGPAVRPACPGTPTPP